MATAFRVSEAASLGLHAMVLLGSHPEERVSAGEIAEVLGVSEAHLAKVMQRLAHVGLVHSTRGPHGGFVLAKACDEITLLDVYEAIEGPLAETTCLLHTPVCDGACFLGDLLDQVNTLVREHLSRTKLCDLPCAFPTAPRATAE